MTAICGLVGNSLLAAANWVDKRSKMVALASLVSAAAGGVMIGVAATQGTVGALAGIGTGLVVAGAIGGFFLCTNFLLKDDEDDEAPVRFNRLDVLGSEDGDARVVPPNGDANVEMPRMGQDRGLAGDMLDAVLNPDENV